MTIETRPGFRNVEFPDAYGELKAATIFDKRLILAFEKGVFYLDGDAFKPITNATPKEGNAA